MTAPIALFVYRRPEHTRRTVEALKTNPEVAQSPLYIFSDGPGAAVHRSAVQDVRAYIRGVDGFATVTVIERDQNWGLTGSIVDGVTRLCDEYGRVIVVEDDLVVSPLFLGYMNRALDHYADDGRVMQVAGHSFLRRADETRAYFLPFTTSWGWGAWKRAWDCFDPKASGFHDLKSNHELRFRFDVDGAYPYFDLLRAQTANRADSWAILWYLSVFMNDGLVAYPPATLVDNIGRDGSGTHGGTNGAIYGRATANKQPITEFPEPMVDVDALLEAKSALKGLAGRENWTMFRTLRAAARRTLRLPC